MNSLITAGTASSEAVLAPVMLKLETLGCAEGIVGMVIPAGYTFNAGGTAIYLRWAHFLLRRQPTLRSVCASRL